MAKPNDKYSDLPYSKKFRRMLKKLKINAQDFSTAGEIKKRPFLAAYAETGSMRLAGQAAAVSPQMHRKWMKKDKKYRRLFKFAQEQATDILEDEARRRAIYGTKKLILHKGEVVMVPKDLRKPNGKQVPYVEFTKSDTLLLALLRANRPEKYRNNVDITSGGEQIHYKQVKGVSPDDL